MLVEAAALAPSAKNCQPWKYIVYTGKEKDRLLEAMEEGLNEEQRDNRLLPKSAFGLPDAFNTLRIMKEAPVVIIVMNTNGQSPYDDVDADGRVMDICDSLCIANTCFAYEKMNHVINAMGKLNRCRCEAPQKRSRKTLEEIFEYR